MAYRLTCIAIVSADKCKPKSKKCRRECKKSCPVVKTGKLCIEVTSQSKIAFISEELCIGCGICVKAIRIINLPKDIDKDITHRYGANTFKLHRYVKINLPRTRTFELRNRTVYMTGSSSSLSSSSSSSLPTIVFPPLPAFTTAGSISSFSSARYSEAPSVSPTAPTSQERPIFPTILIGSLPVSTAPISPVFSVGEVFVSSFATGTMPSATPLTANYFPLPPPVFSIVAPTVGSQTDSAIGMSPAIHPELSTVALTQAMTLIAENASHARGYHNTPPCMEGINIFLAGKVPTENLRFRDEALTFKVVETPQEGTEDVETHARYRYPTMTKIQGNFKLKVVVGECTDSQIIVMLGENGTGKTTFIRMLASLLKPDSVEGDDVKIPEFNVSYKARKTSPKLQSTPADIYLIDEPSAYLDSEQRIHTSKVIKRFILHAKKTAFVVEHDFIMAAYLTDRMIVYEGKPSVDCIENSSQSLLTGMNLFLSHLDITFKRDPTNFLPRINKLDSTKDQEQKAAGSYYYLDD